ncbi:unnamed protein product [Lymnaea stagnalis]|uniref:Ig-like domain-containing protein n=1 Tax=Lymnaea stagnalis TaxID=6523 RepID=A0AAV2IJE9_LYMST
MDHLGKLVILLAVITLVGVASQKTCRLEYAHVFQFSCDVATLNYSTITWRVQQSDPDQIVPLNKCTLSQCQATKDFEGIFLASATTDPSFSMIVNSILYGNLTTKNYTTLKTYSTWRKLECAHDNGVVNVCDTFDVYADARITQLSANNDTQLTANIGDKVHIECLASGFPDLSVWIGKNGTTLTAVGPGQGMDVTLNTCLDAATYVCRAENHNTVDEKGIDIFINCSLEIMNTTQAVIHAHLYDKPTITIHVYGHPSPNHFGLNRASGQKVDNATTFYRIKYYRDEIPYGRVEVQFYQLKESDFTNYILAFGNDIGEDTVYSFTLRRIVTSAASIVSTMTTAGCVVFGAAAMILR